MSGIESIIEELVEKRVREAFIAAVKKITDGESDMDLYIQNQSTQTLVDDIVTTKMRDIFQEVMKDHEPAMRQLAEQHIKNTMPTLRFELEVEARATARERKTS